MSGTITPTELSKMLEENQDVVIFDVRRRADYEADGETIPGAVWRDPEQVDLWSKDIPGSKEVVIYCVKGGSVSKSVSARLLDEQVNVSYIEGGLSAWKQSGGEVKPGPADIPKQV
jgi:rhodanese-related sulfurtransferase